MAFGDWTDVSSSNLAAVRYDAEDGILQVEFKTGAVYEWYGVQADTAADLVTAVSPGKYLNSHIHGLFGAGRRV